MNISPDPSHLVADCSLQSRGLRARGRVDTAPLPSMLHLGTQAVGSFIRPSYRGGISHTPSLRLFQGRLSPVLTTVAVW